MDKTNLILPTPMNIANISLFPGTTVPHLLKSTSKFDGPLSKALWEKASKVPSAYEDNFDYSIYDRLHERFMESPPRGGVVFNTTLKLANYNANCSMCHYSFELDTYGRGCVHNCSYCYAKDALTLRGFWNRPHPFPTDIAEIRKIFATVFETNKPSKWRAILEKRIPLRLGSMSDSFMWMDLKYKVTLELLKILKFYRYPYVAFTRSDLISHDDYIAQMDPELTAIQFSISGDNEVLTKAIEPGAPSVKRRMKALKKLGECGFWTTVRLNPLFPKYPDGYFSDFESVVKRFGSKSQIPELPLYNIDQQADFLDQLKEAKVPTLLAGFVRLAPKAIYRMGKVTDVNLKEFFKPEIFAAPGEKHFSDPEIAYYYKKIQNECAKRGIRFSTCYIGNGAKDYFQYQKLWSNKSDCCDVKNNVAAAKTSSQDIPWSIRHKHAPYKELAKSAESYTGQTEKEYGALLQEGRPGLRLVSGTAEPELGQVADAKE